MLLTAHRDPPDKFPQQEYPDTRSSNKPPEGNAMKKLFFSMALAALLVPAATAQSVFEGTWKIDFSKVNFPTKPAEYLLQNGTYTCKSCSDFTQSVKADGTDQPTPGDPYADTIAVKVVSDHQIQIISKKAGKVVSESTATVSPDGKTLTEDYDFTPPGSDAPVKGHDVSTRVAAGPSGSHAVSGSWRGKSTGMSDNGALFTYKLNGDELTMTSPTGSGFTAKLDGTEAPYKGDPGTTSVRVKLIGKDTLEETDLRDGKILYVSRMTIGPDGKKAKIIGEDKRQNTTASVEAVKQ